MMRKFSYFGILFLLLFSMVNLSCQRDKEKTSLTDERDGTVYEIYEYENQIWMAENLQYATGIGSWVYGDDASNLNRYGRLYNWNAAVEACPDNWRLPDHEELISLVNQLGGNSTAGEILQSEDHFSLTLGGFRLTDGEYDELDVHGVYWSGTEAAVTTGEISDAAWNLAVFKTHSEVMQRRIDKGYGFSVRCLKE